MIVHSFELSSAERDDTNNQNNHLQPEPAISRPVHPEVPENLVVAGNKLDINDALEKYLASTPKPKEEVGKEQDDTGSEEEEDELPLNDDFESVLDSLNDPSENDVIEFPKYNIHNPPVSYVTYTLPLCLLL